MLSNRIFLVLLIFTCLALLPVNVPAQDSTPRTAQTSDDNDGDGVKNSDDRCPNQKGTKANKGCPSSNGDQKGSTSGDKTGNQKGDDEAVFGGVDIFASPKPSPTPTPAKPRDDFDSLKSNIDIMASPKPASNSTPRSTQVSDKELDDLTSNIIFGKVSAGETRSKALPTVDCKYILDFEKCRNILFTMSSSDVLKAFGETKGEKFGMVTKYTYVGMIIDVANTNRVEEVEFKVFTNIERDFKSPLNVRIPAQDINWGAGKGGITKRFGEPKSVQKLKGVDGQKIEVLYYDNMSFEFEDGKLIQIEMKRKISDDEYAQMRKKLQDENAAIEAAKTPEQRARERAKEIKDAYDELHKELFERTLDMNTKIRMYSVTDLNRRRKQEQEVSSLGIDAMNLIRHFLKTYEGRLPKGVVDHLNDDIRKIGLGEGH